MTANGRRYHETYRRTLLDMHIPDWAPNSCPSTSRRNWLMSTLPATFQGCSFTANPIWG